MGRQTDLLALNNSLDTKHYTFTLYNEFFGTRVLEYAPGSWDDDEFQFSRDMKSFGVFRKFAGSVLNFYKDGRDFLRNVYEGYGPNADCTLTVTEFTPWRVTKTRFVGKIDFSSYEITELSVNVKVIDGSFTDKVLSRAKQEVNIKNNRSIDNADIGDISIEIITLPEINIDQVANWLDGSATWHGVTHNLPMALIVNEFAEAQDETTSTPFFVDSLVEYTGCMFGIGIEGFTKGSANDALFDFIFTLERWNGGVWTETLWTETISGGGDLEEAFTISDQINGITVDAGDSLLYKVTRVNYTGTGQIQYTEVQASMKTVIETIAQRLIDAMLYHEAFERIIAHYCGEMGRFKSDFFGRTDIGYAVDGEIGALTTGRNIRLQFGINPTMSMSLEKLFKSLQSIFNLGMGIEVIGGIEKVVIEPMEYFFNTNLVLDLSNRIDFTTIEKKVETPLIHSAINCGYGSYDYLRVGGIYEFNTTNKYTTVVKYLESTLDLISPYRADESGVIAILSEEFSNKDVKGESDIFILDTIRNGGSYIVATNEKIVQSNDFSNRDTLLNLWITPARNVRRWDRYINAFLKWDQSSYLKWQSSDKNSLLQSTETGQAQIIENADIPATEFRTPLWICETYELEVPIDTNDFDLIAANPYGLFKIGPETFGFIWPDYKAKNENNKSSFKLLRYNNAYGKIVELQRFGQLYNWYVSTNVSPIASNGWEIPSLSDFTNLISYAGGNSRGLNDRSLDWWTDIENVDNSFRLNLRGGGSTEYGVFSNLKEWCFLWSLSESGDLGYRLHSASGGYSIATMLYDKYFGASIRLRKITTTLSEGGRSTYTGNDGKLYRTICIDGVEWLADNLNETKYRDGSDIPLITDMETWNELTTGARCYYNNDINNA